MKNKIKNLIRKKGRLPIVMLTAYSGSTSKILDKYCDAILVGDSLANTLYSMSNTHKVSIEMMILHARSVKKGIKKSILIVDMPLQTYDNKNMALKNAKKVMRETKCDAIKIESNKKNFDIVKHLVKSNIPVMGHIGFTPQFKKKFKVSGSSKIETNKLINEAKKIEKAGAFSIVLECIASASSKKITQALGIPTIGIGSSVNCDGQVLVTDDLVGLSGFTPRFVKKYSNVAKLIDKSVKKYSKEVKKRHFPKKNNSY